MKPSLERALAENLIAERGRAGALSYATAQALEHHMAEDVMAHEHWQRVILELRALTSRPPQTSNLDIYRSARILLGTYGEGEALREADVRASRCDALGQAVYARIKAAIVELARTEPEAGERVQ